LFNEGAIWEKNSYKEIISGKVYWRLNIFSGNVTECRLVMGGGKVSGKITR
jgi:hypothetical protein